jgi:DNA-binding response OmpR family regulator
MAKILVADDSRFQLGLLKSALADNGFDVIVAQDAVQAGMMAVRNLPDAIVLDINMPGGSGIEVLKRLRRSVKTKNIPVLIVSGSDDSDIRQVATELGAAEFLPKPVDMNQLITAIRHLVSAKSSCE